MSAPRNGDTTLTGKRLGLPIDFKVPFIKEGIKRIVGSVPVLC